MISTRDSLASSCPATSLKVTPVDFSMYTLALAFPTLPMPPMPPPFRVIRFINSMTPPIISTSGRMYASMNSRMGDISGT